MLFLWYMIQRYFVKLSYLGTNYSGWQIQPNAISVQEVLQNALTKLNKRESVSIMGCGRTDSGVHAENFFMHMNFEAISNLDNFIYKLNHILPKDIVVHQIYEVPHKSHTRFDAIKRTYHYNIHFFKNPFIKSTSYLYVGELDMDKMNDAANILLQHINFKSFCRVKTEVKTFDCVLEEAKWIKTETGIKFIISANRFLRNMVRAIVGTMMDVGSGKLDLNEFEKIILAQDRTKAGKSAQANGLSLVKVEYPVHLSLS